jgi:predicted nucleotidyltransferase
MVEELTRLQAWLDRIEEEQVEDGVTLCGRVE